MTVSIGKMCNAYRRRSKGAALLWQLCQI